ncbi:hypothetical protein [Pseudomonas fluorescens]|uniref:hypothetical protein n=1 Tax=Pseudomonas fluorescens TaxID=294 RepID=UPI000F487049|nr:hypothetical protein [Pseudomonas fluorescens]RON86802.1 hypothetical protein BK668_18765 [Pseudomonas fluorescens]
MNKADFEYEADLFSKQLGVTKFAFRGATEKLLALAGHWKELGQTFLGGAIAIDAWPAENKIEGTVLEKQFTIRYGVLGKGGNGVIEAVVSIPDLVTNEPVEVSRFIVAPNGALQSANGDELINREDQDYGFKSLVVVAKRVLETSARKQ